MHARCVRASTKPHDKAAAKTYVSAMPLFHQTGMRPECVQDASETRAKVTFELSCTVCEQNKDQSKSFPGRIF